MKFYQNPIVCSPEEDHRHLGDMVQTINSKLESFNFFCDLYLDNGSAQCLFEVNILPEFFKNPSKHIGDLKWPDMTL